MEIKLEVWVHRLILSNMQAMMTPSRPPVLLRSNLSNIRSIKLKDKAQGAKVINSFLSLHHCIQIQIFQEILARELTAEDPTCYRRWRPVAKNK